MLGRLKELRIYPTISLKSNVINMKSTYRSHLYMLLPEFSECVISKEADVKTVLRDLFLLMTDDLGLNTEGAMNST